MMRTTTRPREGTQGEGVGGSGSGTTPAWGPPFPLDDGLCARGRLLDFDCMMGRYCLLAMQPKAMA